MAKGRYTLTRIYFEVEKDILGCRNRLKTEEIECKTLKEAIDLGTCLSDEEKKLGSYILDNVNHKKLTLTGEH